MTVSRLTICMPAYKAERYLEATLESVQAQTFPHWELVIVEDGSRDRTEDLVRSFAKRVSQPVHYFRHEKNQGLSASRNTGFEQARTDTLAILDSDDLWRPNHLQLCVDTLNSSGADLAFSGCKLFDSDTGTPLEDRVPPPGAMADFPRSLHDSRIVIQPSTVVLQRSVLARCGGFNTQFPICNDLEFWFRAAKNGCRFAYTGTITCDYRKHATALSKRGADLVAECAAIHRLHRDWTAIPAPQRRRELWRYHRSAAKMLFRSSPLRSLSLLVRGNPLSIPP
jgi:glycosyltransferase involved in cell wall biosynthesis